MQSSNCEVYRRCPFELNSKNWFPPCPWQPNVPTTPLKAQIKPAYHLKCDILCQIVFWRIVVQATAWRAFVMQRSELTWRVFWYWQIWVDVFQVPLEGFALKAVSQVYSLWNIAVFLIFWKWISRVKVSFIIVKPDFNCSHCIRSKGLALVRSCFRKDVANDRARDDFQRAAAHPNAERHF